MKTTRRTVEKGTYQMLWDCPACGTNPLQGKEHLYCPNCGHPKDVTRLRYPRRGERVPARRGPGPDVVCLHCKVACPSDSNNCHGCGAPLAEAPKARVLAPVSSDALETRVVPETGCVSCGSGDVKVRVERQTFEYGEDRVPLNAEVPVHSCPNCDLEYTDHVGEERRDAAVRRHRERLAESIRGSLVASIEPTDLRPTTPWGLVLGILLGAAAIVGLFVALLAERDAVVEVEELRWRRTIILERLIAVHDEEWCDDVPSDARVLDSWRAVAGHREVPDEPSCEWIDRECREENCTLVDNGDSTATEKCEETCVDAHEVCTPRTREVPVYADRCTFTVSRWVPVDERVREGSDSSPAWPDVLYQRCDRLGCERIERGSETYEVRLIERAVDEHHSCAFSQERWQTFSVGDELLAKVGSVTGMLDCISLRRREPVSSALKLLH